MYWNRVDTLVLFIFAEVSNKQLIFWESVWQAIKCILLLNLASVILQ